MNILSSVSSVAQGVQDKLLLTAFQTIPGLSSVAYKILTTTIPTIKVYGFMFNQLLNDESKNKIVKEVKLNSGLKSFIGKYHILVYLCKSDTTDISKKLSLYATTLQPIFDIAGVDYNISQPLQEKDIESIKQQLNHGFSNVIEHMKTINVTDMVTQISGVISNFKVDDLKKKMTESMTKGGRRKHKRTRRRRSRKL
jgi:hypothetical protein